MILAFLLASPRLNDARRASVHAISCRVWVWILAEACESPVREDLRGCGVAMNSKEQRGAGSDEDVCCATHRDRRVSKNDVRDVGVEEECAVRDVGESTRLRYPTFPGVILLNVRTDVSESEEVRGTISQVIVIGSPVTGTMSSGRVLVECLHQRTSEAHPPSSSTQTQRETRARFGPVRGPSLAEEHPPSRH
ncbi:hypothetical protein BDW22DRAFT_1146147 [Trametopsis cervina]|nr:hypothetical protein BDW22DRAFT_1146147 [Trametopsis cervina]